MPRLDRMGVDRRTLDRLASLRVPITLGKYSVLVFILHICSPVHIYIYIV